MLGQPGCILVLPELVQETCRTLDVGKEEGDGAARQLAHEAEPTQESFPNPGQASGFGSRNQIWVSTP
jgi:hypothetical protein